MGEALVNWLEERWPAWVAGVLAWVLLALGAAAYASAKGLDTWKLIVTWDEWVVAIGLLPRLAVPIFRKSEMADATARRVVSWAGEFTWVLFVILVLDLVVRATFGLGWEPF
ncbi:MAG: hypothetical protein K0R39_3602 [Symbiobacteriaceae bacterium]|nr:hypothetical protein [Symbiobacteriaceae bacterium]